MALAEGNQQNIHLIGFWIAMSSTVLVTEWETWVMASQLGSWEDVHLLQRGPVEPVSSFPLAQLFCNLISPEFPLRSRGNLNMSGRWVNCLCPTHPCLSCVSEQCFVLDSDSLIRLFFERQSQCCLFHPRVYLEDPCRTRH